MGAPYSTVQILNVLDQASLWAADVLMEPGCYTFKFLVDGEWKTRWLLLMLLPRLTHSTSSPQLPLDFIPHLFREGDELEEDEKGNVNAVLIVEEDEEEVTNEVIEKTKVEEKEVGQIEDDLDTLTLNISVNTVKDIIGDEATVKEVVGVVEAAPKETEIKEVEEDQETKEDKKEDPRPKRVLRNQENTPKMKKDQKENSTPKVSTPLIKAGKLGTPKVATPKVLAGAQLHPDDVQSPR